MLTIAVVLFFIALASQLAVIVYLLFKEGSVRPTFRSLPFFLLLAACVATAIHVAKKIPEDVFSSIVKVLSNFGG